MRLVFLDTFSVRVSDACTVGRNYVNELSDRRGESSQGLPANGRGMGLAGAFERYVDWAADVSPLYEQLARGVADDPDLLADVTDDGMLCVFSTHTSIN